MRDLGIQKPFLQTIETTSPQAKNYVGVRKLFTDYLAKLYVPFYDPCCPTLTNGPLPEGQSPLRYNGGAIQFFDGEQWQVIAAQAVPDPLTINTLTVNFTAEVTGEATFQDDVNMYSRTPTGNLRFFLDNAEIVHRIPSVPAATDTPFTISGFDFTNMGIISNNTGNVTYTWPTAADITTGLNIDTVGSIGTHFDWTVVNNGSGIVTMAVNTGVTSASVVTGGTTLTVAAGTTGTFRFVRKNTAGTAYQVGRIA